MKKRLVVALWAVVSSMQISANNETAFVDKLPLYAQRYLAFFTERGRTGIAPFAPENLFMPYAMTWQAWDASELYCVWDSFETFAKDVSNVSVFRYNLYFELGWFEPELRKTCILVRYNDPSELQARIRILLYSEDGVHINHVVREVTTLARQDEVVDEGIDT